MTVSGFQRINRKQKYYNTFLLESLYPRNWLTQIFSLPSLNLEKKRTYHSCFRQPQQAEIWGTDVVKNFYLLLTPARGPESLSSTRSEHCPTSKEPHVEHQNCRGGKLFPSSLLGSLAGLIIKLVQDTLTGEKQKFINMYMQRPRGGCLQKSWHIDYFIF